MNKKLHIVLTSALAVSCIAAVVVTGVHFANADNQTYRVDFFENYKREEFELSNGMHGIANNVLYLSVDVNANSTVAKPTDPTRKNYNFMGWYKEDSLENVWNFETDLVNAHTRLYASWEYSKESEDPEPSYTPPSTELDPEAFVDYTVDSVMNFKPNAGLVKVSAVAIARLERNKDNVLPLLEYRVKAGKSITATYAANRITINCEGNSPQVINVSLDTYDDLSQDTYETKAQKYEAKIASEDENYHVMLAGSSSIEFWENSTQDLMPIISYNHGIGGTTIEEWDKTLNARLVLPYKPKMVVYYVGINNVINTNQTQAKIWENLKNFFDHTHAALPNTKVQYIMMNLIPGFSDYYSTINWVNDKCVEYQQSNSWLTLINPGTALLKANGQPNWAYFRTDGLHLSHYGYAIWGAIIKESILKGLQEN